MSSDLKSLNIDEDHQRSSIVEVYNKSFARSGSQSVLSITYAHLSFALLTLSIKSSFQPLCEHFSPRGRVILPRVVQLASDNALRFTLVSHQQPTPSAPALGRRRRRVRGAAEWL